MSVGETGAGGAELFGGLALGGEFVGVLEREERAANVDTGAFGDGEGFELACEGRSDVNEIAFEVALIANAARARTAGEDERGAGEDEDGAKRAFSEGRVFHVLCDRRG